MDTNSVWNSLEFAKIVIAVLTPLAIAVLGFWFSLRLRKMDLTRERERQEKEAAKELKERERLKAAHIELDISCSFYSPSHNDFVAEFTLTAHNKGMFIHRFRSIILRVRGIKHEEKLKYWEGNEPRLEFPGKIFESEIIPKQWNFVFVQPNIKQKMNFVSPISRDYKYIIARAEFHYDQFTPHTVEKVFELPILENH
jgi:hypothetical protein